MTDCPFCLIATGRAPARIVHESADTMAFFPDYPAGAGHTLVIPKAHVTDFLHADQAVTCAVALAVADVGRALDRLLDPEGMNTITSAGEAASQSVPHLHVHVLPRWSGDRMGDLWPEDQATPSEELDALARSLRQVLGSSASA